MSNDTKPVRLSANFISSEFVCPCCKSLQIDMRLIKGLEDLRSRIGKPLKITSGYRCPEHNKKVGGAQASEHVKGLAVDVALPKGITLEEMFKAASQVPQFANGGIGLYPQEGFVHLDVRGVTARWARIDCKYVAANAAFKKEGAV